MITHHLFIRRTENKIRWYTSLY